MARYYSYKGGFGPNDKTLDIDEDTNPNYARDVRKGVPGKWRYILADPPYSSVDAVQYAYGADVYPTPNEVMKNCVDALEVGGRVGLIHYVLPALDKRCKFIACVGICCGFNNRLRVFSVFEKQLKNRR